MADAEINRRLARTSIQGRDITVFAWLEDRQERRRQERLAQRARIREEKQRNEERDLELLANKVYLEFSKERLTSVALRRKVRRKGMRIRLRRYYNATRGEMETRVSVQVRRLRRTCILIYSERAKLLHAEHRLNQPV